MSLRGDIMSKEYDRDLQGIPGVMATETLISLEQSLKRDIPITIED